MNLDNYIISLENLFNNTDNFDQNLSMIKAMLITCKDHNKIKILLNSLISENIIVESNSNYIYRADLYVLKYSKLQNELKRTIDATDSNGIVIKTTCQVLLLFVDIFIQSTLTYQDESFKILINSLIEHRVLLNILDPSHKTNNTFKEMFYDKKI
jgi:hypothetical protein